MLLNTRSHPIIPEKDILSWIFDAPTYDVDKPVSTVPVVAPQVRFCQHKWLTELTIDYHRPIKSLAIYLP